MTYKIAIVGLGKIARDQHVPAITAHPDFDLVAVASRNARLDGMAHYGDIDTLLAECDDFDVVALCTPPQGPPRSGLPGHWLLASTCCWKNRRVRP